MIGEWEADKTVFVIFALNTYICIYACMHIHDIHLYQNKEGKLNNYSLNFCSLSCDCSRYFHLPSSTIYSIFSVVPCKIPASVEPITGSSGKGRLDF